MAVNIFGIALSTASKIIHEVCKTVTEHYGLKYIHFPRTEEEMIPKPQNLKLNMGWRRRLAVLMVPCSNFTPY